MLVRIVVFEGFDELDAIAPYETLLRAEELGASLRVELATVDERAEVGVEAHYHLLVRPASRLGDEPRPDVVVVPGGGWNHRGPREARAEAERGTLPRALADLHERGTVLASVCTGAMLIATAGLLRGRHATTHHLALDELRAAGATVVAARVVDDGDIITAGGVTSGLDLALWLVERCAGSEITAAVEDRMEYERRGTVRRRGRE